MYEVKLNNSGKIHYRRELIDSTVIEAIWADGYTVLKDGIEVGEDYILNLLNSESKGSDSAVAGESGDYTNVSHRTAHGDGTETAVESALAFTPDTKEVCPDPTSKYCDHLSFCKEKGFCIKCD